MSFYGIPSDDLPELYGHLKGIADIYARNNRPTFVGDNFVAVVRNMTFAYDPNFAAAFAAYADKEAGDDQKIWRLHTYCWAGRQALAVPGDFVECGVYQGFYTAVLAQYLSFGEIDKAFYLYDTFAGLPEGWSSDQERDMVNPFYDWDGTYDAVVERFNSYPNIHVIRGVIPDVLHEQAPQRIAFLHLDLNAAQAEIAAIDMLYDRVSSGGIILLDDFGRFEHRHLCAEHIKWWGERGYAILELPTGQGLIVKR